MLLGRQLSTGSLRFRLERLVSLLLNVTDRLDDENTDEDEGEDSVVDSERRRDEFGRVARGEGEEEVLGELSGGEEEILSDGDEEDVDCRAVAASGSADGLKSTIERT